jgi:hypothetical protein
MSWRDDNELQNIGLVKRVHPRPEISLSWTDPQYLGSVRRRLIKTEQRITAERSREVVNWTDKDHRELNRLLKKGALFAACRDPSYAALLDYAKDMADLIDPQRQNMLFEKWGSLFLRLGWWCVVAERHFGKKRHSAIRWLVKQYEDKEDPKIFARVFGGGSSDSIARRIYQKALDIGEFERNDLSSDTWSFITDLVEKAKGDLYQFTFKLARSWPEPGLSTVVHWLAQYRQYLDKEESEILFQDVMRVSADGAGPYELALRAKEHRPDLEYWSCCKARVEKRRQISKSQSD